MNFWIQLAILVVTSILAKALAPKPPKQKPPSLSDFDIPTAEENRPVPVVFGTVTITGPNVVWYGDYEVETQTKDGVKTRTYKMGLHFGLCHGPVDNFRKILVGGKRAWSGRVLESDTITISAGNLFGGKQQGGGIAGNLDVMMGEATQTANAYLSSVQGTPQPAYRGVLSAVFNKGMVSANSTYLEPWAFQVKRTRAGWYNDSCWYPETAEVSAGDSPEVGDALAVHYRIDALNPGLYLRFDTYDMSDGAECANSGSAPVTGMFMETCVDVDPILTSSAFAPGRSVDLSGDGLIRFPPHADFNYFDHNSISVGVMLRAESNFTGHAYIFHHGDKWMGDSGGGLSVQFNNSGADIFLIYRSAGQDWQEVTVTLDEPVQAGNVVCLGLVISTTGGANGTGYLRVYKGCTLQGTADFTTHPVDATDQSFVIGARETGTAYDVYLQATLEYFFVVAGELGLETWSQIADAAGACQVSYPHINPAHVAYEAITNPHWGMGLPAAMIDDTSFTAAADTFFAEGLGLSFQWLQQEPVEHLIQLVCDHAGAICTQDPSTGKFLLKPLRGDYTVGTLPTFDGSNARLERYERAGYGELVGEINVVFREWQANVDTTTPPQHNLATIQSQLGVVSETVQYPAIPTISLANRIAARDLAARSVPLARGTLKCNRAAWDLTPGDCFRLTWTPLGITQMVCRVASIDYGTLTEGEISVEWAEDVFGLPDTTYAAEQPTGWTEPNTDPEPASAQAAIELPYAWLVGALDSYALANVADASGYGALLAAAPPTISDRYEVWASLNAGAYTLATEDGAWAASTTLGAAVVRADTDITLAAAMGAAEVGDLLQLGNGGLAEFVRVAAIDGAMLTVHRGIYDTTPQEHAAGARVWLLPGFSLQDPTVYTDGDDLYYKPLTVTSTGTLDIAEAAASSVTMASRQIRPYAPGNVVIDSGGENDAENPSYPDQAWDALTITWAHRDRVVQAQTAIVQTNATDYGPEAGATYSVYLYDAADESVVASQTGITGTTCALTADDITAAEDYDARLEIAALRDGYECWQRQVREFRHKVSGLVSEEGVAILRDDDGGFIRRI